MKRGRIKHEKQKNRHLPKKEKKYLWWSMLLEIKLSRDDNKHQTSAQRL